MKLMTITSAAVLSCAISASAADTCTPAPSCADLGYTQSTSSCKGGKYVKCPFDTTKVACIALEPHVGDLKYSLDSADHDGWLLCDGREFKTSQYPKLKSLIGTYYCHKYTSRTDSAYYNSNCTSGYYAIPDYRGFFLKGAAISKPISGRPGAYDPGSSSITTSAYSSALYYKGNVSDITTIRYPLYEELPNIKGSVKGIMNRSLDMFSGTGAFWSSTKGNNTKEATKNSSGNWWNDDGTISFSAYSSNPIYGGAHVVPANYGAYIFIYAGPSS